MDKDKLNRHRFDFSTEVISLDKATGTIQFRIIPDPRRYEWMDIDGERHLFDKFDQVILPVGFIEDIVKHLPELPYYKEPQMIGSAAEYVNQRIDSIRKGITGEIPTGPFIDKSEEFLEALHVDELGFVVLSIDVVNSTVLSTTIPPEQYARTVAVLQFELSQIVPHFHGHVLKYTGDGLIAYFAEPGFTTKNDLAIDCALTLRRLVYSAFNAVLKEFNYSHIDIRIGLDSGLAYILTIGSPESKRHKDIIGSVVNLAAKIQSITDPGGVRLGQATLQSLHTKWRIRCKESELPPNWPFKTKDGQPYQIHQVFDFGTAGHLA